MFQTDPPRLNRDKGLGPRWLVSWFRKRQPSRISLNHEKASNMNFGDNSGLSGKRSVRPTCRDDTDYVGSGVFLLSHLPPAWSGGLIGALGAFSFILPISLVSARFRYSHHSTLPSPQPDELTALK